MCYVGSTPFPRMGGLKTGNGLFFPLLHKPTYEAPSPSRFARFDAFLDGVDNGA